MLINSNYSIGDQLSVVDLNGKVYRIQISSIATYDVAKQFGSVEVIASSYVGHETINKNWLFYICSNIPGESSFSNLILWDDILDHTRTKYISSTAIYKTTLIPINTSKSPEAVISELKAYAANNIPDYSITFEDITEESEEDVLEKMKTAVALAQPVIDDVKTLEVVRPLINQLSSLDVNSMTTDIKNMLADIQARLSGLV